MKRRYTAAIFDLDGTLTDNMPLHWEAYALFMQRHGLPPITDTQRAALDGKRNDQILPVLFQRDLAPDEVTRYADEKEATYRELAASKLQPLPGLDALLDALEARGVPIAVATSAPPANVSFSLAALGLGERVHIIARGDEVTHGKPAPDVFLLAAQRLGVAPEACLVFEDALAGIEAAHAANMACVAVTTTNSREALQQHGVADIIVGDFVEYLGDYGEWLKER
jgi:beta-phosphoglucomutase